MKKIVKPLMEWYGQNARVLPWRQDATPYHVWLSEIMLQQTRVEAVKEYYRRFLERLPEVQDLAAVDEEELMKLWQGLGYYNRARNLQRAAKIICEKYSGNFPQEYEEWLSLPGIGEYTAGAVVSIAFGKREPAVDGNVYRIYTRLQAAQDNIGMLDKMIGDIEPSSDKLPVLLKKYISLNARIVGFNIDPKFNMCLDGLLILDLFDVPMNTIESLSKEINDETILNRFTADNVEL